MPAKNSTELGVLLSSPRTKPRELRLPKLRRKSTILDLCRTIMQDSTSSNLWIHSISTWSMSTLRPSEVKTIRNSCHLARVNLGLSKPRWCHRGNIIRLKSHIKEEEGPSLSWWAQRVLWAWMISLILMTTKSKPQRLKLLQKRFFRIVRSRGSKLWSSKIPTKILWLQSKSMKVINLVSILLREELSAKDQSKPRNLTSPLSLLVLLFLSSQFHKEASSLDAPWELKSQISLLLTQRVTSKLALTVYPTIQVPRVEIYQTLSSHRSSKHLIVIKIDQFPLHNFQNNQSLPL